MNSIQLKPVIKIFPISPPRTARKAYTVVSRKLYDGTKSVYDVVIWGRVRMPHKHDKFKYVTKITCECMAAQYGNVCNHILIVAKRICPTASFWRTETDAVRQHRRYYPLYYGPNRATTKSRAKGGIVWMTERHAHKRIRASI